MLRHFTRGRLSGIFALLIASTLAASVVTPGAVASAKTVTKDLPPVSVAAVEGPDAPAVSAPSGLLMTSDGRVLWERAPDKRRRPASTIKMLTALVVLERARPIDRVVVDKASAALPDGVGLKAGERYTVSQLLEFTLVASANDAASTLAVHVAGSVPKFVKLMNAKARELGLKDTEASNPSGLYDTGQSTAADLSVLAREFMRHPEVRRIVLLPKVKVRDKEFEATNKLVGKFDGLTGVKTGFTQPAGYCLVASARRNGVELLSVVLGAKSEEARFAETRALLEWGFTRMSLTSLVGTGTTVARLPVAGYVSRKVAVRPASAMSRLLWAPDGPVTRTAELTAAATAPVRKGDRLGTLRLEQGGKLVAEVPLVAVSDVPYPSLVERARVALGRTFGGASKRVRAEVTPGAFWHRLVGVVR